MLRLLLLLLPLLPLKQSPLPLLLLLHHLLLRLPQHLLQHLLHQHLL